MTNTINCITLIYCNYFFANHKNLWQYFIFISYSFPTPYSLSLSEITNLPQKFPIIAGRLNHLKPQIHFSHPNLLASNLSVMSHHLGLCGGRKWPWVKSKKQNIGASVIDIECLLVCQYSKVTGQTANWQAKKMCQVVTTIQQRACPRTFRITGNKIRVSKPDKLYSIKKSAIIIWVHF